MGGDLEWLKLGLQPLGLVGFGLLFDLAEVAVVLRRTCVSQARFSEMTHSLSREPP